MAILSDDVACILGWRELYLTIHTVNTTPTINFACKHAQSVITMTTPLFFMSE